MTRAKQHAKLLATLALLFLEGICAAGSSSTAIYVPCEGGSTRLLQLDELVRISDIVMSGLVLTDTIRQDDFGTFTASVSYYYAYKNDPLLSKRGIASTNVIDFPERPGADYSLFFLVRQPNAELSVYCMATVNELARSHASVNKNLYDIMDQVRDVSKVDTKKNKKYVPPYPNPCDPTNNTTSSLSECSSVGSQCTVKNTLSNETSRCTCISGFHGDGFVCTPRTEEAAKMACIQCTHGARCRSTPNSGHTELFSSENDVIEEVAIETTVECTCDHFRCTGMAHRQMCGTDGVTYRSECHLRKEACLQQTDIYKLHDGECQAQPILPCGGMNNPLSTSAGLVTCSKTRACPKKHFCYSTDTYDVCCPVTAPGSISPTTPSSVTTTTAATDAGSATLGSGGWNYTELELDTESSGDGDGDGSGDNMHGMTD